VNDDFDATEVGKIDLALLGSSLDTTMAKLHFYAKEAKVLVDFFEYVQGDIQAYQQIFSEDEVEQKRYLFGTYAILSQEQYADHKERWDKIADIYEKMARALIKHKALSKLDPKEAMAWLSSSNIQTTEEAKARAKSSVNSGRSRTATRGIQKRISDVPELPAGDFIIDGPVIEDEG
jgi:crotonobetainyl-CoA:carnitine CoA-transferase CaiB-like acyl-CoA transferase